jgi:UDP-glucose 4-epimerase
MPMNKDHQREGGQHLILGGSGFVGRHVALMLARLGHRVIIASRNPPNFEFPVDVIQQVKWMKFDLANPDWETLLSDVVTIHHGVWTTIPATANANPADDLSVNVISLIGLLEALCRKVNPPNLIFISSGGTVYGKLRYLPAHEDHALMPISAYGVSKASAEFYLGYYRAIHGLDCRIVRLSNPFGGGQNFARGQGAVTTFLHHALIGKTITIWGDGEIVRDYIHISDAAAGIVAVALATQTLEYWTFNIASGQGISLNGILDELETQLSLRLDVQRLPSRSFDVPVSILDVTRAHIQLGWSPHFSFSEGMVHTINDLKNKSDFSIIH